MLSPPLVDRLNEQINLEFYSANLYLQMSSWCEARALNGCASFLAAHAEEEMGHMRRLWAYVNGTGAMARMGAIDAPPSEFEGIRDVFRQTYEHEKQVTAAINGLVDAAFTSKDYSTFHFLQWYVAEQHEEEKLFKDILDKIELIGTEGQGLFYIDRELEARARGEQPSPPDMDQG
jgi:ferritin